MSSKRAKKVAKRKAKAKAKAKARAKLNDRDDDQIIKPSPEVIKSCDYIADRISVLDNDEDKMKAAMILAIVETDSYDNLSPEDEAATVFACMIWHVSLKAAGVDVDSPEREGSYQRISAEISETMKNGGKFEELAAAIYDQEEEVLD